MPAVSVIVPVYNTEKYIRKCLDSLTAQTLRDIEIICVNDCSTDGSLDILREYAARDTRIKIIDFEQNRGAAAARNTGIDAAAGEYIGFVDSDDFIDPDFYEKLYTKATETGADIVKGADLKICYPNGTEKIDRFNEKIRTNKYQFLGQYTTAIFNKSMIQKHNISFPIGLSVGEDPCFLIHAVFCTNKIEIIDDAQYYYMRRDDSLNSEYWTDKKVSDYIKYINTVCELPQQYQIPAEHKRFFIVRLLEDVYSTITNKTVRGSNSEMTLMMLMNKLHLLSLGSKIKLLYDGTVLRLAQTNKSAKRGIYYVSLCLLKQFLKDDRFDVTLLYSTSCAGMDWYKNDPDLKNLKSICTHFALGQGANNRLIPNKNFNPQEYDVYFNPAHNGKFFYPSLMHCYILHDAMPMFDNGWFPHDFTKVFYDFYHDLPPYTHYFAVSESSKRDFLEYFDNMSDNYISVAPNSSAQEFKPLNAPAQLQKVFDKYETGLSADAKYTFYMGAVDDKRKNLVGSVKYFIDFIEQNNVTDLYFLLGGNGKEKLVDGLKRYLGDRYEKYAQYIIPLGYVDNEDVNILYSHSLFFTFLSLYEGFGMPPLEAMMSGTPVICANNSSLPEVVGDAALLVDENDEEQVLNAFKTLYFDEDKRNDLIKKGIEQAKNFSWDKTYKIISNTIINTLYGVGNK